MAPKVSIIVPLAGGPAQALRCFEGIAVQPDDPAHEIIVVDDASIGLEPLLSQLAGDVEVLRNERRLGFASSARRGAEHARGEIIVFIRDAAAPAPGGSRRSPPRSEIRPSDSRPASRPVHPQTPAAPSRHGRSQYAPPTCGRSRSSTFPASWSPEPFRFRSPGAACES